MFPEGTKAYILSYVQSLEKYASVDNIKTEKKGKFFLVAKKISN